MYESIEKIKTIEECCQVETKLRKSINKELQKLRDIEVRKEQIRNENSNQLKFDI